MSLNEFSWEKDNISNMDESQGDEKVLINSMYESKYFGCQEIHELLQEGPIAITNLHFKKMKRLFSCFFKKTQSFQSIQRDNLSFDYYNYSNYDPLSYMVRAIFMRLAQESKNNFEFLKQITKSLKYSTPEHKIKVETFIDGLINEYVYFFENFVRKTLKDIISQNYIKVSDIMLSENKAFTKKVNKLININYSNHNEKKKIKIISNVAFKRLPVLIKKYYDGDENDLSLLSIWLEFARKIRELLPTFSDRTPAEKIIEFCYDKVRKSREIHYSLYCVKTADSIKNYTLFLDPSKNKQPLIIKYEECLNIYKESKNIDIENSPEIYFLIKELARLDVTVTPDERKLQTRVMEAIIKNPNFLIIKEIFPDKTDDEILSLRFFSPLFRCIEFKDIMKLLTEK